VRPTQDITYGVTGQSLYLDVPEGRPASVTSVDVLPWDFGDDDTAEFSPTGTIDSVNTTFDAASGVSQADARICNLTATTSIVQDREYLATNAAGEKEWVDVGGITSGASIQALAPLRNDYAATTGTFVGTRITATVDATWVADDSNISDGVNPYPQYRVRWVYVVGSTTYTRYTYFDLVRQAGVHGVTAPDIENLVPGFIAALPRNHQEDQGRRLIDAAYDEVQIDLYQEKIPDEQVRDQHIIDTLIIRKTIVLWSDQRIMLSGGSIEAAELAAARYQTRFDQLFRYPSVVKAPVGQDSTGAGSRATPPGISRR